MLTIEQIRRRLDDKNLSELAKHIKVTRSYLSNIKNGRIQPSEKIQMLLSLYLGGSNE